MLMMGDAFGNNAAVPASSTPSCVVRPTLVGPMVTLCAVSSSKSGRPEPAASLAQLVERTAPAKQQVMRTLVVDERLRALHLESVSRRQHISRDVRLNRRNNPQVSASLKAPLMDAIEVLFQ